jgi:DNA-directed RNA polymerase subunit RPC12/RpoP
MKLIKGSWRIRERCADCFQVLTRSEVMRSYATCPKCGFRAEGAVTIVKTVSESIRPVYRLEWFWGIIPYHKFVGYEIRKDDPPKSQRQYPHKWLA